MALYDPRLARFLRVIRSRSGPTEIAAPCPPGPGSLGTAENSAVWHKWEGKQVSVSDCTCTNSPVLPRSPGTLSGSLAKSLCTPAGPWHDASKSRAQSSSAAGDNTTRLATKPCSRRHWNRLHLALCAARNLPKRSKHTPSCPGGSQGGDTARGTLKARTLAGGTQAQASVSSGQYGQSTRRRQNVKRPHPHVRLPRPFQLEVAPGEGGRAAAVPKCLKQGALEKVDALPDMDSKTRGSKAGIAESFT